MVRLIWSRFSGKLSDPTQRTVLRVAARAGVMVVAIIEIGCTPVAAAISHDPGTVMPESEIDTIVAICNAAETLYDEETSNGHQAEFLSSDVRYVLERHGGYWIVTKIASESSAGKSIRRLIRRIAKRLCSRGGE